MASDFLTPFDRAAHEPITVTDFQGTHYSATRLWNVENDEITYYPLDSLMTIYKITGEAAYEPETTENKEPQKSAPSAAPAPAAAPVSSAPAAVVSMKYTISAP